MRGKYHESDMPQVGAVGFTRGRNIGLSFLESPMSIDTEVAEDESGEPVFTMEGSTELTLGDGECWIFDPDFLHHDAEFEGVLAVQFKDGGLYYLDGMSRKWVNVEGAAAKTGKPSGIRSVQ